MSGTPPRLEVVEHRRDSGRGSSADSLRQECVAEQAPVRHRGLARLDPDHLHADVVGAGLDVGLKLVDEGVQVAPEHEVVDDAVAAAVADVLFGVSAASGAVAFSCSDRSGLRLSGRRAARRLRSRAWLRAMTISQPRKPCSSPSKVFKAAIAFSQVSEAMSSAASPHSTFRYRIKIG
jgi:hypothetical protein